MAQLSYNDLLDAGVHFGHLTRKWDPKMAPYIFMEKNGIHIIDLNKTISSLDEAAAAMRLLADDASLRFRIGCAGRQRVADLTLHECGLRALRALCLTNLTQM